MPSNRLLPFALLLSVALCSAPELRAQPRTLPSAPAQLGREAIDRLVQRAFDVFHPVGLAVAVVDGDAVVLETARGVCEVGGDEAVTPRTVFNIASCTKAFTAACVAKLVERGALGWDDRVVDHLPGFELADPWITRQLTVRDLLCHRSGLKTFEGDLLWYGSDRTDADVFALLQRLPITQRFRDQFGYQNLMYMVAGMLVEHATGHPWQDVVRGELMGPLGMAGSAPGFALLPTGASVAMPHIDGQRTRLVTFEACKPAAAIWASVHDLTAWLRMLLADGQWEGAQLLSPDSLHEMWRPYTPLGRGGRTPAAMEDFSSYGLGWFLYAIDGKKVVEHDGGMPGYISKVTLVPADRFGFVILNNGMDGVVNVALRRALLAERSGQDGMAILDRLGEIAARRRLAAVEELAQRESRRRTGTTHSRPLPDYAGRYTDHLLGDATLELRDGALQLTVERSPDTLCGTLSHWHDDTFRVDFPDRFLPFALLRFDLGFDGSVAGFRIDCPIDDFDFSALDFRRLAGGQ
ncbi:MAG: serine hydrolase [Planctomycetes bacterium]|nr:serine hydrolase [Planctomycetota bacterium]